MSSRGPNSNWRLNNWRNKVVLRHASRELKEAEPAAVERVWQRLKQPQPVARRGLLNARNAWLFVAAPSLVAFASGVWVGTRAEREGMFGPYAEARLSADASSYASATRGVVLPSPLRPAGGAAEVNAVSQANALPQKNAVLQTGALPGSEANAPSPAGLAAPASLAAPANLAARPLLAEFGAPNVAAPERAKGDALLEVFHRSPGEALISRAPAPPQGSANASLISQSPLDPALLPGSPAVLAAPSALGLEPVLAETPGAATGREAPLAVDLGDAPWQLEANAGDYAAALEALKQSGGFEQVLRHASAEQLMLLFDVARAAGQQQRALAALRRIVTEFRSDPVAPLAAWSLGTSLEKTGDQAGARRAFATYRLLAPAGEFAEDSLVRELRYAIAAGDKDSAHQLIAAYENDFPTGRQRSEIARLAKRLNKRSAGAGDAGPEVEEPASEDSE